jgi:hypothetical protein
MGDNGLAEQLWEAVEDGDEANVRRLLKKGANPNYTSSYNPSSARYTSRQDASVLMVSCHKGSKAIVQVKVVSISTKLMK